VIGEAGPRARTAEWDGLHTRHLLESTYTQTHTKTHTHTQRGLTKYGAGSRRGVVPPFYALRATRPRVPLSISTYATLTAFFLQQQQ